MATCAGFQLLFGKGCSESRKGMAILGFCTDAAFDTPMPEP